MVSNYLPFMILPLYAALERFDFSLVEAARDLGASRFQAFVRIVLPLTSQAIISGSILVFMPALGEFIIPDFLGGARVMLMGNLITEQFLKARDWPFGAALAVLMLATVMLPMIWSMRRRHSEVGLAHG
jgi:spermidine/putrescine transport system permease protein